MEKPEFSNALLALKTDADDDAWSFCKDPIY